MRYTDERVDEWFAERLVEQDVAHDGEALRLLVDRAISYLPDGPVTLLSTSLEGCALAAATAALREQPTRWARLVLGRDEPRHHGQVVVLEAVILGSGLRAAICEALPDAAILDVSALARPNALRSAA